jgi:hypothetical protein
MMTKFYLFFWGLFENLMLNTIRHKKNRIKLSFLVLVNLRNKSEISNNFKFIGVNIISKK